MNFKNSSSAKLFTHESKKNTLIESKENKHFIENQVLPTQHTDFCKRQASVWRSR